MDPNKAFMDMFSAMSDDDHESAREIAIGLKKWFARGGFTPHQFTRQSMIAYVNSVLRRTVYLDFRGEVNGNLE